MSIWARRRARSVKSAKVWRRIDLSARRQTISWRGNTCSARRKIAERVSGKSIIRPFMAGIVSEAGAGPRGNQLPGGSQVPTGRYDSTIQRTTPAAGLVTRRPGIHCANSRAYAAILADRPGGRMARGVATDGLLPHSRGSVAHGPDAVRLAAGAARFDAGADARRRRVYRPRRWRFR